MKFFIDTANLEEIKTAVSWGVIDGATTNPSLMAKEKGQDITKLSKEICKIVPGPVSLEGIAMTEKEIVEEGKKLSKIAPNVVVKVAMSKEGICAVKTLTKLGIKTNVTLVFSSNQALLAAKAGATYVSPFLGRLDDVGHDSIELIHEILQIYANYDYKTEIISASVRHADHVRKVALAGSHIATIPFKVLKQLYTHPLTDKGIELFVKDWKTIQI